MLTINKEQMQTVASQASQKINETIKNQKLARRWNNAIVRALVEFDVQSEFMSFDGDALLIWSQKSDEIYSANGVCQCKAYQLNQPCWHRAASRLVKLYEQAH